jgi:hypothetical protein
MTQLPTPAMPAWHLANALLQPQHTCHKSPNQGHKTNIVITTVTPLPNFLQQTSLGKIAHLDMRKPTPSCKRWNDAPQSHASCTKAPLKAA